MKIEVNQKILFDILAKSSNSDGRGGIGREGDIKFNVHVNNGGKYIYFYTAEYDEDGDEVYDTLINTIVGENGIKLSGGQKQRISIARAILKKSPIILLDEATSSLDTGSEEIVQNAISNLTKNKTTIVIAHRLSTIHNADKIFVLKNGILINSGDHESLINTCNEYKSLYEKQLK